ncbi:hypothetical protein KGQ71_01480, partial [Patescibacteria group bacterium]|nr:hypothetical protein [Patescibacteria group bacterium]
SLRIERAGPISPQAFSLRETLLAAVWPILSFMGGIASVNIGGEVRNARQNQLLGIFGSIVLAGLLMALLSTLGDRVFQPGFQAALGAYAQGPSGHSLPVSPYFSLLASLSTQSPVLAAMICIGFFTWACFWIPATLAYATRAMIAWSFDRIAPAALGYVHPRRHTPVTAIVAATLVNIALLALFLFVPFVGALVLVLATMLAWLPTMLGAMTFPWRRSELFHRSSIASQRVCGLPMMSLAGAAGFIAVSVLAVMLWNDSIAAGHAPQSLITIALAFGIGLVWYLAAKALRRRQGLRIDRAFSEIPIE